MTIKRLIELLENAPLSDDTIIEVDVPDSDGYCEEFFEVIGVCIYNNDSIHLKTHKQEDLSNG